MKTKNALKRIPLAFWLSVILPLIIGLGIYIIVDNNSYLYKLFGAALYRFSFMNDLHAFAENNSVFIFLRCYICDFCWAFSLEGCVFLIFRNERRGLLISAVISIVFSVFIETLQYFNIIIGTFDFVDIIFEIIAVLLAVTNIYFIFWRNVYEKNHKNH